MDVDDTFMLTKCWGMLAGRVGVGAFKKVVLTSVDNKIRVEMHEEDDNVRVIDVQPTKEGIKPFCDHMIGLGRIKGG